jgi:hypothetical protein
VVRVVVAVELVRAVQEHQVKATTAVPVQAKAAAVVVALTLLVQLLRQTLALMVAQVKIFQRF